MIGVDTNILVYAHRKDSPFHLKAKAAINTLQEGPARWAAAWSSLHEFLAVVTNGKFLKDPTPLELAFGQIEAWLLAENFSILVEGPTHLTTLRMLATEGMVRGGQFHDARIAAICLQHGVTELWTADRDFSRFPKLRTRNPLVG